MTSIKLIVSGASARAEVDGLLTSGMVGIPVTIVCDSAWDGLTKALVCRAGHIVKTILNVGNTATVAHECMIANATLQIGVEGRNADGTLVIPTVWARCGLICSGANAEADPSTDPTLPVWAQIQRAVGNLDNLTTEAKDNLVAAINEAMTKGGGEVDPEAVRQIVEDYLAVNPPTVTETDPTVPAWAKQPEKPSYTASEIGADPSGTAAAQVAAHNTGTDTHSDIRMLISGLTNRLNALADSDDTTLDQLSEVVAYIKNNRELISAITTDKVSVADIVNNLTTNVANKPLSAAQGVALKALIDAISVPDKLPNPNTLTFTGAVTGSYDGSAPLSVEIPSGGGGSGGAVSWKLIRTINIVSGTSTYSFNTDNNGNAFRIKNFLILIDSYPVNGYLEIKPNGSFSFMQNQHGKQNYPFSFMMKRATDGRYILENSNTVNSIFERKISNEYSSFGEFTSFSLWFSSNPAFDTTMYILGEDV